MATHICINTIGAFRWVAITLTVAATSEKESLSFDVTLSVLSVSICSGNVIVGRMGWLGSHPVVVSLHNVD